MIDFVQGGRVGVQSGKFDPRRLTYDRNGIPFLSRPEIESVATEFLWEHCPSVLAAPGVTPVLDILDRLKLQTGLCANFVELGRKGAARVVARVCFRKLLLYLDFSLAREREAGFRFALAHQVGHWALHRYNHERWYSADLDTREGVVENPVDALFPFRRRTPAESLEFQARTFAAALVMPRQTFASAFFRLRQDFGFLPVNGCSYLEKMVLCLSDIFQVSTTCVRIRIEELKLLARGVFAPFTALPGGGRESAPIIRPTLSLQAASA